MIYNTAAYLWTNLKKSYESQANGGSTLVVTDGMIYDGSGVVGSFESQEKALCALRSAGFVEVESNHFRAA